MTRAPRVNAEQNTEIELSILLTPAGGIQCLRSVVCFLITHSNTAKIYTHTHTHTHTQKLTGERCRSDAAATVSALKLLLDTWLNLDLNQTTFGSHAVPYSCYL